MEFEFKNIIFVNYEPNIGFKRPDGVEYQWDKLTVSDENLNAFWLSVDKIAEADMAVDVLKGKKVRESGKFRLFKGIPKFKVNKIILDK
jgi:hypothetical protein